MRYPILAATLLLILATLSHALIIESGDGGAAFATDTSVKKCREANVAGVYVCSGNVVKAVSAVPGEGSTFYKPDGRVITCPPVAPSDMGAECVQLLSPHLCPNESVCAAALPPPQNISGNAGQPAAPQPPAAQPPQQQATAPPPDNASRTAVIISTKEEKITEREMYVLGVVILGMIVIAGLHYMYLRTKSSDTS